MGWGWALAWLGVRIRPSEGQGDQAQPQDGWARCGDRSVSGLCEYPFGGMMLCEYYVCTSPCIIRRACETRRAQPPPAVGCWSLHILWLRLTLGLPWPSGPRRGPMAGARGRAGLRGDGGHPCWGVGEAGTDSPGGLTWGPGPWAE